MTAYLFKSTLLLTVFYAFFMLFMRKTTFWRFNRIILLAGTAVCLVVPLLNINWPAEELLLPQLVLPEARAGGVQPAPEGFGWKTLLHAVYAAGCAAVVVSVALSLLKIRRVVMNCESVRCDGFRLHLAEGDIAAFSFMNHIVISRADFERHPEILLHERMHVRFAHSVDMLFISLVCAFQWFNPLVWLMRSEIGMLHEYEADEAVLKHGIDASQYQLLLVRKAVGDKRFLIANSFNVSKLKNRITMMQKNKTNKWARLGYLACLPLMCVTLCFCSGESGPAAENSGAADPESEEIKGVVAVTHKKASEEPAPVLTTGEKPYNYSEVEVKPRFNAGGIEDFSKWVAERLEYPEAAAAAGVGGTVMVSFKVNSDGKVSDVTVLRGAGDVLDKEAVRVVSSSPDWTPASVDGKPVAVTFAMPIVFRLQENS